MHTSLGRRPNFFFAFARVVAARRKNPPPLLQMGNDLCVIPDQEEPRVVADTQRRARLTHLTRDMETSKRNAELLRVEAELLRAQLHPSSEGPRAA